jgi:hypothetical protein
LARYYVGVIMGWEEVPADLTSRIWNRFHVEKYLNETLGEGKWEEIDRRGKYRWSNSEIVIDVLFPTSVKQGKITIDKNGEKTSRYTNDIKEIKEMI